MDVPGDTNRECNDVSTFKEDVPGLALAVDKQQGHCWYNGNYNNRDFSIQPGLVGSFRAYEISAPKTKAKKFAASDNTIWLSFEKAGSFNIYTLDKYGELQEQGNVTSAKADTFVKIPVVVDAPKTLVIAPSSMRATMWPQLAAGVEGAIVWQDSNFKITGHRWDVSVGQPFDPSKDGQVGLENGAYNYGSRKYFFPVSNNGQEGVVWQDPKTLKIFLSWLSGKDMAVLSNFELPTAGVSNPILNAAAGNGKGEVVASGLGMCFFL